MKNKITFLFVFQYQIAAHTETIILHIPIKTSIIQKNTNIRKISILKIILLCNNRQRIFLIKYDTIINYKFK